VRSKRMDWLWATAGSFEFDEGKLREIPIVRQVPGDHIRH
jgi:hypothetical protein